MNKGILYAVGAYILWGVFPIFWKLLLGVPAFEILSHRIVWSLFFMLILIVIQNKWAALRKIIANRRQFLNFGLAGFLLAINWVTYIWAVNAGYIVESSLGYFINPLINVLLGVILLRERLRPWQWASVGLATAGVIYLTFDYGRLPWIALTLAISFGLYGYAKKRSTASAVEGFTMEVGWLFIFALGYLLYQEFTGAGAFGHAGTTTTLLLAFAGFITALPLVLFAMGAKEIPLSLIGILQYIAPTGQFLIGVFIYNEPFTHTQLIGFGMIWIALIVFTTDTYLHHQHHHTTPKVSARRPIP